MGDQTRAERLRLHLIHEFDLLATSDQRDFLHHPEIIGRIMRLVNLNTAFSIINPEQVGSFLDENATTIAYRLTPWILTNSNERLQAPAG